MAAGAANDVYPDEPIQLFDKASADAMGAAIPRAEGLHRQGRDRRRRRLRLRRQPSRPRRPRRPQRQAATAPSTRTCRPTRATRSSSRSRWAVPEHRHRLRPRHARRRDHRRRRHDRPRQPHRRRAGREPRLLSIGEVLFTTAVVTAYDYLLDQPNLWSVEVINNSWGNSFQQFDPRDPVAVATKAVADLGVNVIFAAGNSGYSEAEMGLNPFSRGPVGDLGRRRDARPARPRRLLVERPDLRQLAGRSPSAPAATPSSPATGSASTTRTSPRPATDISSTCDTGRHRRRACPPGREHRRVGHEHGLAARRRRRRRAAPGEPDADARPGAARPSRRRRTPVDRRRHGTARRSGRSATATSTSPRRSTSSAARRVEEPARARRRKAESACSPGSAPRSSKSDFWT